MSPACALLLPLRHKFRPVWHVLTTAPVRAPIRPREVYQAGGISSAPNNEFRNMIGNIRVSGCLKLYQYVYFFLYYD